MINNFKNKDEGLRGSCITSTVGIYLSCNFASIVLLNL